MTKIPTLKLADSDKVHPHNFKNLKDVHTTYARGYPLGTEYQQFTKGIVSGLKHAREQYYIVTTSTINSGNSGGPCVNEDGDVIGINSMKLVKQGVEEINMIIPSNRVKLHLPSLMDNSENKEELEKMIHLAKILYAKKLAEGATPSRQQVETVSTMMQAIPDVDYSLVVSNWNQHNVGGFKKCSGIVQPVTISDWFMKHVHEVEGSHALLKKVFTCLNEDDIATVSQMRKEGFKEHLCVNCAHGDEKCATNVAFNIMTPPKAVHIPQLGFKFSNGNENTLKYYKAPPNVKSGVIITASPLGGLFHGSGVLCGDLLYSVGGYSVDNYGECWDVGLNVSLKVVDVFHRSVLSSVVVCGVCGVDGVLRECGVVWCGVGGALLPSVRFLDSVHDASLSREIVKFRGVTFKSLRLEDVYQFGLGRYLSLENQHGYRVVVCDLDASSVAYGTKSLRPGDVLHSLEDNDKPVGWEDFLAQLKSVGEEPAKLHTESNTVIIL